MAPQENDPERWAGLQQRATSALVLAVPALFAVAMGGFLFAAVIIALGLLMLREWDNITSTLDPRPYYIYGGLAYIAIPCASLIWLRNYTDLDMGSDSGGAMMVLYLFLVVWATDIGAYFAGRQIGGPKLAPEISPNKTWAGLGGGCVAAAFIGMLLCNFTPFPNSIATAFVASILIAAISQAGDLFESWVKRKAGVKDSGTLIPGHGGLLDRVDGLLFAAPFYAFMCLLLA